MGEFLSIVVGVAAIVLIGMLYFWPTITAYSRGHQAATGIMLVNLLFGWTLIGWLVAIVWSYSGEH